MIKKKSGTHGGARANTGGARPGAGAKPVLLNGRKISPYLDEETITVLTALGNGTLSSGIRKARQIVQRLPVKVIAAIAPINDLEDPNQLETVLNQAFG